MPLSPRLPMHHRPREPLHTHPPGREALRARLSRSAGSQAVLVLGETVAVVVPLHVLTRELCSRRVLGRRPLLRCRDELLLQLIPPGTIGAGGNATLNPELEPEELELLRAG